MFVDVMDSIGDGSLAAGPTRVWSDSATSAGLNARDFSGAVSSVCPREHPVGEPLAVDSHLADDAVGAGRAAVREILFVDTDESPITEAYRPDEVLVQVGGACWIGEASLLDDLDAMMTADVNAVIAGVLDAEPSADVVVADAYGPFRNLLPEDLDQRARLIRGRPRPLAMMAGLCDGVDAVLSVGYHARARPQRCIGRPLRRSGRHVALEADLYGPYTVDAATLIPGVNRVTGARTPTFTGRDVPEAYGVIQPLVQLAQAKPG